jgi:hypothetical protein
VLSRDAVVELENGAGSEEPEAGGTGEIVPGCDSLLDEEGDTVRLEVDEEADPETGS